MGLSAPWADYLDIIALQTVKNIPWVTLMELRVPMADSLDIIAFQTAKKVDED